MTFNSVYWYFYLYSVAAAVCYSILFYYSVFLQSYVCLFTWFKVHFKGDPMQSMCLHTVYTKYKVQEAALLL